MAEGNLYQEKKKSTTIHVPRQEQEIRRQQEQEIRQQRQQERQEAPAAPRQTLRQPLSQQSPLLRETVKRSRERTILMPEIVRQAATEEEVAELPLSRTRVERMLEESEQKFAIQNTLRDSVRKVRRDKREGTRRKVQHLDMDQAMKLSDKKLAERAGLFDGPRDYLLARYRLIKNDYYTAMPEHSVKKLTSEEIAGRLSELEQQEQRNEELIKYFQALQSIRELEAENGAAGEKKSTKKRTKRAKQ